MTKLFKKRGWIDTWLSQMATILPNVIASIAWYLSLVYVVAKGFIQLSICILVVSFQIMWIVAKVAVTTIVGVVHSLSECRSGENKNDMSDSSDDTIELEDNADADDDEDSDDIPKGMRLAAEKGARASGFTYRRIGSSHRSYRA